MADKDVICDRCGATPETMDETCTAALDDPCPGFIELARRKNDTWVLNTVAARAEHKEQRGCTDAEAEASMAAERPDWPTIEEDTRELARAGVVDTSEWRRWERLVRRGLAVPGPPGPKGETRPYYITEAGRAAGLIGRG